MPVTSHLSKEAQTVTIRISGRFDFNLHREFRSATELGKGQDVKYVLDFSGTEYIDSSALGMLLLLRERAGGEGAQIRILNCNLTVRKILATANFQKLFKIE